MNSESHSPLAPRLQAVSFYTLLLQNEHLPIHNDDLDPPTERPAEACTPGAQQTTPKFAIAMVRPEL